VSYGSNLSVLPIYEIRISADDSAAHISGEYSTSLILSCLPNKKTEEETAGAGRAAPIAILVRTPFDLHVTRH
jgi:hypothetical protein